MNILRVALDLPLPRLFDYRSDDATRDDIGHRVLVPFGKKRVVGVIVEISAKSDIPDQRLRPAEKILRELPPLSPDWIALARFCSDYYQRPLGEVIMGTLPPRLRTAKPIPAMPVTYALSSGGREAIVAVPARRKRLCALLERLARGPAAETELRTLGSGWRSALQQSLEKGWVEPAAAGRDAAHFREIHSLTREQQQAVGEVRKTLSGFAVTLLFGITGSGKTEIYLRLIAEVLGRGGQALVLVPEIALTPALEAAFRQRFPNAAITVQTSAMAELERTRGWLAAQSGRSDIVLGTRLAVFAPMPRLALVVVDEEQDASFKQQEGLRYSARDVAIVRAQRAGVPVVLCSATPSLETFHRARSGKYGMARLTSRAIDRAELSPVRLVDLREHPAKDGLAAPVVEAVSARLARGEQSLVFLNRRGYAPVLACQACGWVKGCARCSAHMVLHLEERTLRCHHCGLAERVPKACPQCGNVDLRGFGRGTQRVEATLAERFPQAGVLRLDSDSARARGELDRLLDRAGRADILVGTQILAKGHHFERLTLVAVLNADSGLFSSDYRAGERMFAQLHQVAGRAGRAGLPGEVMIQTRYPRHPLYQSLQRHDFAGFCESLLAERRQAGFPPFVFEAVLRAESSDQELALRFLKLALERAPKPRGPVSVFDPAPMSLARLAGMERAQVLLQSGSRPRLQEFLREWSGALYDMPARGVRWHIDVDPTEF
jgi:primosomal protein N' (replication factor Y) (superfamily II helicase)